MGWNQFQSKKAWYDPLCVDNCETFSELEQQRGLKKPIKAFCVCGWQFYSMRQIDYKGLCYNLCSLTWSLILIYRLIYISEQKARCDPLCIDNCDYIQWIWVNLWICLLSDTDVGTCRLSYYEYNQVITKTALITIMVS